MLCADESPKPASLSIATGTEWRATYTERADTRAPVATIGHFMFAN
jgi:hypothetical protein